MRLIQFVIAALPGASAAIARGLTDVSKDNCARAITGTARPSLIARLNECAMYQDATLYPTATTKTVYGATADTTVFPDGPTATVVHNTVVPSYASKPCGTTEHVVASRYASACSCAGYTKTTVTAPTSTVTVSTTASSAGSAPTCRGITVDCANGRGLCQYSVVDNEPTYDLVCAFLSSCNYEAQCENDSDCGAGEACVNAGFLCSINNCAALQN
ncbi:hypothetical protein M436DRAFT_78047 [Aureobasidium namibiae CBS 147.97]|uniref:Uncharacterized protein n=1 Tax=Aureobasidium namibiae CBS 147.97 TaxID=1043004 RepID=A0A074XUB7_9PEZI